MNNLNKQNKLLLTFFFIPFVVWIGGSLVRTVIAYSVFEPSAITTLIRQIPNDILMQSAYLYSATNIYTLISYLIAFVSAFILLFRLRPLLKTEGWLLMSFILFFISAPIQFYNAYLDINLSIQIFWNGVWEFYSQPIQHYFLKRFTSVPLNSLSGLSFLANLTILIYIIWQPLKKHEDKV